MSFNLHCKQHRVKISNKDQGIIRQSCFKEKYTISHLWTSSQQVTASSVPPIIIMAGRSERHVVRHAKENYGNSEVIPCAVQTLTTTGAAVKRFFGVVNAAEVCESVHFELSVVNKTMDLVLGNPVRLETISERNIMMDWYPEPDSIANSHSTSPIPLRFRCLKSDRSLLQLDKVGRNCAKLQYLMKLAVLESVVAKPTVDEHVKYMKQLQPLVNSNGNLFSVFTFICSTSSLARKVAASTCTCSNRLPIIARLDFPLHVV